MAIRLSENYYRCAGTFFCYRCPGTQHLIAKEVGIFCCSKNWSNPLLWSHYAARHRGISLGFDMPDHAAIEVEYKTERPLFTSATLSSNTSHTTYLEKLSKTKFKSWEYEEEVRFIYLLQSLTSENFYNFKQFDHEMILKEVIIGCQSTLKINDIVKALNGHDNITIIGSRMAYKSFRIVKNLQEIYKI